MKLGAPSRGSVLLGAAIIALTVLLATAVALAGKPAIMAIAALIAMSVGLYIGLRHPLWLYWGMAVAIGTLPFGYFPGVHLPLYLPFAGGALMAALIHPNAAKRFPVLGSTLAKAVLVLVIVSGISMIVTFSSIVNILDYTKWAIATGAFFAILALPREHLSKFGRIFAYAAAFNAAFGIASILMGSNQILLQPFRIFGYAVANTERFFFTGGTPTNVPRTDRFQVAADSQAFSRLGGLWLDPNAAGIGLVISFVVAMIVFAGWRRVLIVGIIGAAIALTLSRSAIVTVLVGVVLVFIFHPMRARDRQLLIGTMTLAVVGAFMVPSVRTRLLGTLSENDAGATDRVDSIREFPGRMDGHWLFGWGWSQREFKDGAYAFLENFVSNAPLIAIHRGGIFVGIAFLAVVAIGCFIGYRLLRANSLPSAVYGGVFIGFSFVALNLDHPVVIIPQIVFLYTIFLVFLVYADQLRIENREADELTARIEQARKHQDAAVPVTAGG
ncbi:O-antigen ligase family protein [Mycolicibacterium neoaurum]|uniref:O-antigen ligase family protein n=1 Tax=Mycolicibacterium neoaurum TaxID=1795 RepID=UPI00248BB600|nr:O-antigen ligase family protein [Mycolicibacterium neoaurum]WBP93002.1 O-antigen ligase family protein [Mycolicibacterium neoaurum]WBS06650.1 O-antigen ligase family protein [Mycolicibacterium neoaurum]